jgi:hypothetical protein
MADSTARTLWVVEDSPASSELPLPPPHIFFDFEFRSEAEPILGCFWRLPDDRKVVIDLREPIGRFKLAALVKEWSDGIWFCYSARAELSVLLHAGVDIRPLDIIDLMPESRQITGTHHKFEARRAGLLVNLEALGVPSTGNADWKESMRLLILSKTEYTAAEWKEIIRYCWSDIAPLPEMWRAIVKIHASRQDAGQPSGTRQTTLALHRGDFLKALTRLEHRSRGFPVDEAWLNRIFDNQKLIRRALAERANQEYGGKIFRWVPSQDAYAFNFKELKEYVIGLPWKVEWELTKFGKPRTDEDYLDEFVEANPHFIPLKKTLMLLHQLKAGDMRALVRHDCNGHAWIKGNQIPFYTRTGRSQPLVRDGYLFNLPHWMRTLVRPHPGHIIVSADWSQQELCIGASLSGDKKLAEVVASGDAYLNLGQMAGIIPPDGTKVSHKIQRAAMKAAQLGLGFGMGIDKLGHKLFVELRRVGSSIDLVEATEQAREISNWHRATFKVYWDFVDRCVQDARSRGWCQSRDGWVYFANLNSKYTRLMNFPMQANGAAMLRETIRYLDEIEDFELMATLHDGLYAYCHEDQVDFVSNHLRCAMDLAARRVLHGAPLLVPIKIGVETFDHQTGYHDDESEEMYSFITNLLAERGV